MNRLAIEWVRDHLKIYKHFTGIEYNQLVEDTDYGVLTTEIISTLRSANDSCWGKYTDCHYRLSTCSGTDIRPYFIYSPWQLREMGIPFEYRADHRLWRPVCSNCIRLCLTNYGLLTGELTYYTRFLMKEVHCNHPHALLVREAHQKNLDRMISEDYIKVDKFLQSILKSTKIEELTIGLDGLQYMDYRDYMKTGRIRLIYNSHSSIE